MKVVLGKILKALTMVILRHHLVHGQSLPHESENIDFITTFSNQADKSNGDDDYQQTFFIVLPKTINTTFFIRVFDPDTGGAHDEVKDNASKTRFSIYGGKGSFSDPKSREITPKKNDKPGLLLGAKTFNDAPQYDNNWFVFGPFNPKEGELINEMEGYVFKIVVDGLEGRSGNMYRFFISQDHDANRALEGVNAFTYKYTFRLMPKADAVALFYPFVNKEVVSLKIHTFDFDNDGKILLYSTNKNRQKVKHSNDNEWSESTHVIDEEEKNTTVNIQIVKKDNRKNDMVMYVTNQYNKQVPFYAIPIGGPPKYRYKVNINYFAK